MPRAHAIWLVAALALSGCSSARYYGVSVDRDAPPPPRLAFYERPSYIAAFGGGVYVVDAGSYDYDMFQYGSHWYVYTGSYWYRASDYNGPYADIRYESVPDRVLNVPDHHWKRGHPRDEPPGQTRKRNRDRDRDRYRDRDRDWDS